MDTVPCTLLHGFILLAKHSLIKLLFTVFQCNVSTRWQWQGWTWKKQDTDFKLQNVPARRPKLNFSPIHVEFVVYEVASEQVFPWVLQFSPRSSIPLLLSTHSFIVIVPI
jgi:N-acyl-L-homoserine lactone synthetase